MGRYQYRTPILYRKLPDQVQQLPHTFRVNAERRLIHDDDLRILHQHIRNAEPLPHTFGVRCCLPVCSICHADPIQQVVNPLLQLLSMHPVQSSGKPQILSACHITIKADIIRKIPDHGFYLQRISRAVTACNLRCACRWLCQPEQHQDRCRLSCAVRSEQSEDFSFVNGEIQIVYSDFRSVPLRQMRSLNNILHFFSHVYRLPNFLKIIPSTATRTTMIAIAAMPHVVEVFTDTRKSAEEDASSFLMLIEVT